MTFTLSRQSHLFKFGGEFLHVQTKINDLNATIGRMNFENRFTNRAVGDLLLGLPSQLALTSYTVMDQGQDMQFYFIQDDYRMTQRAHPESRTSLRVRDAAARARRSARQFRSRDGPDDVCAGRRPVRAGVDSSRSKQFRSSVGILLFAHRALGRARRVRHLLQSHGSAGPRGHARLQPAVPRGQPAADGRFRCCRRRIGRAVSI